MIYCTTVSKHYICPMWNIPVTIRGKYGFFDEKNPFLAKYISCECPIVANLTLPHDKQNKEYSLFRYCKCKHECLSNIPFKTQIDVSKDGYSQ